MRIFLTGATGYIGAAVLEAFVRSGHRVDALVRNSVKASQVQARGATPVLGDLREPASFADAAASVEGIVHTALDNTPQKVEVDARVIDTLLASAAASKTVECLIYTSGTWVIGNTTSPADETTSLDPPRSPRGERPTSSACWPRRPRCFEQSSSVPVSFTADRAGSSLMSSRMRPNSLIRVVGPGDNRWPLVYDRDLADLYVRIAVTLGASGLFHANDEGDEHVNDIVAAISHHAPTRPSVRHVPLPEARKKMGAYADALALDQVVRSPRARALGWNPSLKSVSGNAARLMEEWRRGSRG